MNISTFIICIIIIVIGACAILSCKKKLKSGCCCNGCCDIKIAPSDTDTSHYAYKSIILIDGLTCQHCAVTIENAFNRREGYMAKVNLRKNQAELWSKEIADADDIRRTLSVMGYPVAGITTEKNI